MTKIRVAAIPVVLLLGACAALPQEPPRWVAGTGVPKFFIEDVRFLDERHGWAVSHNWDADRGGDLFESSDGGRTWMPRPDDGLKGFWRNVWFLDAKHGFVVGGMAAPEWYVESKLAETVDGGRTWINRTPEQFGIQKGVAQQYSKIRFFNATDGLLIGTGLLATHDAGKTWTSVPKDRRLMPESASFTSMTDGWAILDKNLSMTVDGGRTWTESTSAWEALTTFEQDHAWYQKVYFLDDRRGWAMAGWNELLRTVDGGITWTRMGNVGAHVNELQFLDADRGWALVRHESRWCVYRTTDGGAHWTESYGSGTQLNRMFFLRPDLGWVCGDGVIVRFGSSNPAAD